MLHRFRETWQQVRLAGTVHREAAARLLPVVGASLDANSLDRTPTATDLTLTSAPVGSQWFALEDTAGFKTGDPSSLSLMTSPLHVDCG